MKTKRFLSIALALCMMLSLLPVEVQALEWPEAATRANVPQRGTDAPSLVDGYYEIYNADQLYWFAEQVNGGSTSINGKLMADIVVNENVLNADGTLNGDGSNFRVWTPIGYYNSSDDEATYSGTFDGNSKTVSGLYFNDTSKSYVGLFGYVDYGAVIKNVGVVGSYLRGGYDFGGVVGHNNGSMSDCFNTGAVEGFLDVGGVVGINYGTVSGCHNTGTVGGDDYIGGVVGGNYGKSSTVQNCYNTGTVSGSEYVGGVVGKHFGTASGCYNMGAVRGDKYIGGVVGYKDSGTISGCYNTGAVSGSSSVGGMVGRNYGTIRNSYNSGSVSSSYSAGGVVGYNLGPISNSHNTGAVSGREDVGGVVGYNDNFVTVSNCYNAGSVSGDSYVGGVVGYKYHGTIRNCYYLSGCVSKGNGYGAAKSAGQFAFGEVAYLLQSNQVETIWGQTIGTDSYPVFGGEAVYKVVACDGFGVGFSNDENATLGHQYYAEVVAPTCTEGGCTVHTCLWCSDTYTNAKVDAVGHRFDADGLCAACDEGEPSVLNADFYEISNAGQLYWFAEQVNSGNNAINGKLMADIVVNENVFTADGELNGDGSNFRVWTPIGDDDIKYSGTFDGNGKTISGLYSEKNKGLFVGLFGYVGTDGKVQNVGVIASYIGGDEYVGGVAGYNYGSVSNCYNTGTVEGFIYVGGVVGINYGTISNCYKKGNVSGEDGIGGIVAENLGTVSNSYNTGPVSGRSSVGGVVGDNSGTVSDCYNTGSVKSMVDAGGVVSYNTDTVSNCYNTGTVSGIGNDSDIGGVVARNYGSVSSCYNTGSVSGISAAGGVVAYNSEGNVSSCYNTGSVSCKSLYVGAVVGYNGATVRNCYYLTGRTSITGSAAIISSSFGQAKTAEQFISGEVAYLLGTPFGQTLGTDRTPKLGGPKVYKNQVGGCNADTYQYEYSNEQADAVTAHDWTDATCVSPKTCKVCDVTEGVAIGHQWTEKTCTEPMICKVCNETSGNAPGHSYNAVVTAPGCMTDGYTVHTCTVCGDTYRDGYTAALGHSWVEASCTEAMHCTTCGHTLGVALGHRFGEVTIHKPTPGAQGYSEHICTICGFAEQFDFVEFQGVTLSGQLTSYLEGNVTVEMVQGGKVVYSTIASGGSYAIEAVVAGEYTLRISKANHVPMEIAITVGQEPENVDATICLVGDITGDGMVTAKDFARLLRHINKTDPLSDYALACGDLTGDGYCNIKDFQRMLRHVNKTNPLY